MIRQFRNISLLLNDFRAVEKARGPHRISLEIYESKCELQRAKNTFNSDQSFKGKLEIKNERRQTLKVTRGTTTAAASSSPRRAAARVFVVRNRVLCRRCTHLGRRLRASMALEADVDVTRRDALSTSTSALFYRPTGAFRGVRGRDGRFPFSSLSLLTPAGEKGGVAFPLPGSPGY